ncbi:MAG: PaaI family thioesterase [Haloferacaceae archaeon]
MDIEAVFNGMPFADLLGVEVTAASEGHAEGRLELTADHSSIPGRVVAHGGVAYALADTVGGAAVISLHQRATPTVDMRIDYLSPATEDLLAEADVVRNGSGVAAVEVTVSDVEGAHVADARGVYKTGGGSGQWDAGDVADRVNGDD